MKLVGSNAAHPEVMHEGWHLRDSHVEGRAGRGVQTVVQVARRRTVVQPLASVPHDKFMLRRVWVQ